MVNSSEYSEVAAPDPARVPELAPDVRLNHPMAKTRDADPKLNRRFRYRERLL